MTEKAFGILIGLLFGFLIAWGAFEAGTRIGILVTWHDAMKFVGEGCQWQEVEPGRGREL